MRSSSSDFTQNGPHPSEWTQILTVRVISGYKLPKKLGDSQGNIVDPYVRVSSLLPWQLTDELFAVQHYANTAYAMALIFFSVCPVSITSWSSIKIAKLTMQMTPHDNLGTP